MGKENEQVEVAAKAIYNEHTQLGGLINELQQENKRLKEKKARAEDLIRSIRKDLGAYTRAYNKVLADLGAAEKRATELEGVCQQLQAKLSTFEGFAAGVGVMLRGLR